MFALTPSNSWAMRLARYRDVGLALALCAAGEYELISQVTYDGRPVWPGNQATNVVLIALLTLPLVWRRRYPVAVCLFVFGLLAGSSAVLGAGEATTEFLIFIATTFTAAAYVGKPVQLAAAAVAALAVHELRDPSVHGLPDAVWALGLLAISFLLGRAVYVRQHRIGSLEHEAVLAEERHTEQVAAATAAERAAIARELHDIVAHAVSVIVIQAQAGSRALPGKVDVAGEVLNTIETSARTALAELRRLLTLLAADDESAATAPTASLRQLPDLLESCRRSGLDVDADLDDLPSLPPASDLAAYRVIQESLTNTLRHAPGASAKLSIRRDGNFLEIVAVDDGALDAQSNAGDGTGRGLIGMRERLAMVGGRLIEAAPQGSGYRVYAIIPLDAEDATANRDLREIAR